MLEDDGPPCLVVCLSHPAGRWSKELCQAPRQHVGTALQERCQESHAELRHQDEGWLAEGLLIMSAWRLVQAVGTCFSTHFNFLEADSRQVMHNLLLSQCSTGLQAALEYPVLAASYFPQPHPFEIDGINLHDYTINLYSATFAVAAWEIVGNLDNIAEVRADGRQEAPCTVQDLCKRWSTTHRLGETSLGKPSLMGWRVWRPLGFLMCHGEWYGDAVAIQKRLTGRFSTRLCTEAPPSHLAREYILLKAMLTHAHD